MFKERIGENAAQQIIAASQIRFGLANEIILYQINLTEQDRRQAHRDDGR